MFTEQANLRATSRHRGRNHRLGSHNRDKVVPDSPPQNPNSWSRPSVEMGVGFTRPGGKGGRGRGLGSDIDLVVNFSAPAGLVATFVCARGMRGDGVHSLSSIRGIGGGGMISRARIKRFLRLHLRAI